MSCLATRALAAACMLMMIAGAAPQRSAAAASRRIVIAELFTSEGCSSCPPADHLLRTIVDTQPVEGVEVVGLEEHVDYWDHQGWRDPFSSALLTRRQSVYAASVFHIDDIYTPQLVVNGERECIGGDATAVRRALTSVSPPSADLTLSLDGSGAGRVRGRIAVDVTRAALRGSADVMVALVEDDLTTRVRGGENSGRVLTHAGVVRSMVAVSRIAFETQSASVPFDLAVASGLQPMRLRLVAFVQDRGTRRILGAAVTRVPVA